MTARLSAAPVRNADPILSIMAAFRADPRPDKIDLGIGLYRDADGRTPVMAAVAAAEARILATQETKAYTTLAGDSAFCQALGGLVLGPEAPWDRLAAVAAPGGTGALHQAFSLLKHSGGGASVWLPEPTWPNHPAMLSWLGLPVRRYSYLDGRGGTVDPAAMLADLAHATAGDAVVLHACCHNPSGADPDAATWEALARRCAEAGLIPIFDVAYQGLGGGLTEDVAGLRRVLADVPEALVAVSGSKTFGLYRERVGLLLALTTGAADRAAVQAALDWQNRLTYAFPPDHGARTVTEILSDPSLRRDWAAELAAMRGRLSTLRSGLAAALRHRLQNARFDWIAAGNGLFARLPASADQIDTLRDRHGIYVIPDGRLNIAGLSDTAIPRVADALAEIGP